MKVFRDSNFIPIDSKHESYAESIVVHARPRSSNDSLVVFVHGLGGRRYGTWTNIPKFLFEDFHHLDIALYDYPSGLRRFRRKGSIPIAVHAREFADSLRDGGYRNVVLVGHSMGGLLCKAVVKELLDSQACTPSGDLAVGVISGLFLMATPQAGSQRVPGFLAPFTADGRVLRTHSSFVSEINERFKDRVTTDANGGIPQARRICIPTYAVLATGDAWVDRLSASLNLSRDQIKTVRGTHTSFIKISSREEDIYSWLTERIQRCVTRPQIERLGVVEMIRPEIERVIAEPLSSVPVSGLRDVEFNIDLSVKGKTVSAEADSVES